MFTYITSAIGGDSEDNKRKWEFSTLVAFVRFHRISYDHLINFLNKPKKVKKGT